MTTTRRFALFSVVYFLAAGSTLYIADQAGWLVPLPTWIAETIGVVLGLVGVVIGSWWANRAERFVHRLGWYWDTRDCPHPEHRCRRISGDERMWYGYRSRCMDCGKALGKERAW